MENDKTGQILEDEKFRKSIFIASQKYLINTLFDAINSILGVVIGLYLANQTNPYVFMMTIFSTAIALGISSGSSIYEAEYLEQVRKIQEIEKHMVKNPEESKTIMKKKARITGFFVGAINLLTPLLIAAVLILLFAILPQLSWAFWVSIILSAAILFVTGIFFGKLNKLSPLKRGVRMLLIGATTFVIVYTVGLVF